MNYDFDKAKAMSILDVAGRLGLTVYGHGSTRNVAAVRDSATGDLLYESLMIDLSRNTWKRFSGACRGGANNDGGDVLDLVRHIHDDESVTNAYNWLMSEKSIPTVEIAIHSKQVKDLSHEARGFVLRNDEEPDGFRYLHETRGICEDVLRRNYVGFCNVKMDDDTYHGCASLPWITEEGAVVAIRKRIISPRGKDERLRASAGSVFDSSVYGGHLSTTYPDPSLLLILEGEVNALSGQSCGYHAVSIGGQSVRNVLPIIGGYASNYRRVIIWTDELESAFKIGGAISDSSPLSELVFFHSEKDCNDYLLEDPFMIHEIICDRYLTFDKIPQYTRDDLARFPFDFTERFGVRLADGLNSYTSYCPYYGKVGIIESGQYMDVYSLNNLAPVWTGEIGKELRATSKIIDHAEEEDTGLIYPAGMDVFESILDGYIRDGDNIYQWNMQNRRYEETHFFYTPKYTSVSFAVQAQLVKVGSNIKGG